MRDVWTAGGELDPHSTRALYGTVGIQLEAVGALVLGKLDSLDPERPGVVVFERRTLRDGNDRVEITLRFGSLANRRDVFRFDGGYTALHVRWVTRESFGGAWSSGVRGPEAEGYFCATRVTS